jgi:hypothetical protein
MLKWLTRRIAKEVVADRDFQIEAEVQRYLNKRFTDHWGTDRFNVEMTKMAHRLIMSEIGDGVRRKVNEYVDKGDIVAILVDKINKNQLD